MANGMNKVILIGNLGKDPEVKYGANGKAPYCDLRLACTERRKVGDNKWEDHTEWVDVRVLGKSAENCGQHLRKGRQISVDGKIETSSWEDKTTKEKKYKTRVLAREVLFLGGGRDEGGGSRPQQNSEPPPADGGESFGGGGGFGDDDLPW